MQTGVVDGAENNPPSYVTGKHYRYAKYYTHDRPPDHPRDPGVLEADLGQLSKDDQALIKKVAKEAQLEQRTLWDEMGRSTSTS